MTRTPKPTKDSPRRPTNPLRDDGIGWLETRADEDALRSRVAQCDSLDELAESLGIGPWDYLLVGDGSGSRRLYPGGWATALVHNRPRQTQWFFGGMSNASNISMEMMAYVEPLLWLLAQGYVERLRVHVVTDCNYLVENWSHPSRWKANRQLWLLLQNVSRSGIALDFHWIPRDTVPQNQMADALASVARRALVDVAAQVEPLQQKYSQL